MNAKYTLAINSYIAFGGDGFECFEKPEPEVRMVLDPENTIGLIEMLL